jgi:thiamine biosynthesis lipoprotein
MGMAISIDIPKCDNPMVFNKAFKRLHEIDNRYSTYKKDSELCRYQRQELTYKGLSTEFKAVMKACEEAEALTDGYFSAYFSGEFNPTGYVKGWAMAGAGRTIEEKGHKTYCIGAGGDILARSDSGKVWNVGIQDPLDKQKILNKLSILNGAVATSGSYEKGVHIIDPKTSSPANELLGVTVTGPDIIKADVLATAIFAEGLPGLVMAEETEGYEAMATGKNSDLYLTSNFPQNFDTLD